MPPSTAVLPQAADARQAAAGTRRERLATSGRCGASFSRRRAAPAGTGSRAVARRESGADAAHRSRWHRSRQDLHRPRRAATRRDARPVASASRPGAHPDRPHHRASRPGDRRRDGVSTGDRPEAGRLAAAAGGLSSRFRAGVAVTIRSGTPPGTFEVLHIALPVNEKMLSASHGSIASTSTDVTRSPLTTSSGAVGGTGSRPSAPDVPSGGGAAPSVSPAMSVDMQALDRFTVAGTTGGYLRLQEFLDFIHNAEAGVRPQGWFEGRGPFAILLIVLVGGRNRARGRPDQLAVGERLVAQEPCSWWSATGRPSVDDGMAAIRRPRRGPARRPSTAPDRRRRSARSRPAPAGRQVPAAGWRGAGRRPWRWPGQPASSTTSTIRPHPGRRPPSPSRIVASFRTMQRASSSVTGRIWGGRDAEHGRVVRHVRHDDRAHRDGGARPDGDVVPDRRPQPDRRRPRSRSRRRRPRPARGG